MYLHFFCDAYFASLGLNYDVVPNCIMASRFLTENISHTTRFLHIGGDRPGNASFFVGKN